MHHVAQLRMHQVHQRHTSLVLVETSDAQNVHTWLLVVNRSLQLHCQQSPVEYSQLTRPFLSVKGLASETRVK